MRYFYFEGVVEITLAKASSDFSFSRLDSSPKTDVSGVDEVRETGAA
jgi:hypothetical protein